MSDRRAMGRVLGATLVILAALAPAALPAAPTSSPAPGAAKPRAGTKPAGAVSRPAPAKPASAAKAAGKPVGELARDAREFEDAGAYARALELLRQLRHRVKPDADLELALALDEARSGLVDSARIRLKSPLMSAAAQETLPVERRREYPYRREYGWLNGQFDGWAWYVWRSRAEIEALAGDWEASYLAARQCVDARPLTGKEWLLLAVSAGRTHRDDEARQAALRAAMLDPTLPEAHYLAGLWDWKSGRRAEAHERFRQAVALDSGFVKAALATMRARIPGIAPDTLPAELLTGARRVGLLTDPAGPKPEEFVQMDVSALLDSAPDETVQDSIPPGIKPLVLVLSVLIDEHGRPVLNDFPWFPPGQIPAEKITRLLTQVPRWRFTPAIRLGRPHPVWVNLDFNFIP